MSAVTIRKGAAQDAPSIYGLIKDLAEYEKALHKLLLSAEQFAEDGFGAHPQFETLVAEQGDEIVGMMLFYNRYSTWRGKCVYLEDFAVKEALRNQGVGQLLFDALKVICEKRDVALLTWQVLDWNTPAIAFYQKNKATLESEWVNCKIETSPTVL